MTTEDDGRLRISLITPDSAQMGSMIPMVVRLENVGDEPLELYLRGRTPAFDIIIRNADGDLVWQRLASEVIPGILQFKLLEPGGALDLFGEWSQRGNRGETIESGLYSVQGFVLTDRPEPLRSPITQIVIAPR